MNQNPIYFISLFIIIVVLLGILSFVKRIINVKKVSDIINIKVRECYHFYLTVYIVYFGAMIYSSKSYIEILNILLKNGHVEDSEIHITLDTINDSKIMIILMSIIIILSIIILIISLLPMIRIYENGILFRSGTLLRWEAINQCNWRNSIISKSKVITIYFRGKLINRRKEIILTEYEFEKFKNIFESKSNIKINFQENIY